MFIFDLQDVVPGAIKTSWIPTDFLPDGWDASTPRTFTDATRAQYLDNHPPDTVPTCDMEGSARLGATDDLIARNSLVMLQEARNLIGPVGPIIPYALPQFVPPSELGQFVGNYYRDESRLSRYIPWMRRFRQHAAVARAIFIDAYAFEPSSVQWDATLGYLDWTLTFARELGDWPCYTWMYPKYISDGSVVPRDKCEELLSVLTKHGADRVVLWQGADTTIYPLTQLLIDIGSDCLCNGVLE